MGNLTNDENAFYGLSQAEVSEQATEDEKDFSGLVPSDLGDLANKLDDRDDHERAKESDVTAYNTERAKLEALIARLEAQGINIEGARGLLAESPDGMNNQQLSELASRADTYYREAAGKELQLSVSSALEAIGSGAKLELAWAESNPAVLMQLAKPNNALSTQEALVASQGNGYSLTS